MVAGRRLGLWKFDGRERTGGVAGGSGGGSGDSGGSWKPGGVVRLR